jgi:beta-barrel assembly-enhancing protease
MNRSFNHSEVYAMYRLSTIVSVLVLSAGLAATQAYAGLISEKDELQMGKDAAKQIEAKYRVSTDTQLTAQIQRIGRKIAAKSSRPNIQWQFKILESKDVNALSVPGYVYVYKGLIDFANGDEAELAGVIGHEIAHTAARHVVKAVEKQFTYGLAIQLLMRKGNARNLGNAAASLALLGYSRKDEFQADKLGVDFMNAAGYDSNGMLRFFRKLQQLEGNNAGGLTVYFKTHPPTDQRIKRVGEEMVRLGVRVQAALPHEINGHAALLCMAYLPDRS